MRSGCRAVLRASRPHQSMPRIRRHKRRDHPLRVPWGSFRFP